MKLRSTVIIRLLILLVMGSSLGCSRKHPKRMAIQPFTGVKQEWVDTLSATLERVYDIPVVEWKEQDLPPSAFIHVKSPRYRADSLIHILKRQKPDSVDVILGITNRDISTTKYSSRGKVKEPESKYRDWGIFGLGFRPGPSCVVSTFRLKHKNPEKFMERLKKVSVHEVGHTLGLKHCPNSDCVMQDAAETIRTVDRVQLGLCTDCKRLISKE